TPASRARVRTSSPERSGILMSTRATSKLPWRSAASASLPLPTVCTVWPCCAQARSRTQRIDSSSSATRIEPVTGALSSAVADIVLAHGERHAEAGTAARARLVADRASVLGDDPVAEREPEARSGRLGGEERREEAGLVLLGDAGAAVLDRDGQEVAPAVHAPDVEAGLDPRRDDELPGAAHRLDRVLHQVQEDLDESRPVAADGRQARVEFRPHRDALPHRRLALERQDVVQHAMDVDGLELQRRRRRQLAELLDQPVEALDLADDDVGA